MANKHDAIVPSQIYSGLQAAFDDANKNLFGGKLGRSLLTLRAISRSYGYYHTGRFIEAHGRKDAKPVPEIALNPKHFGERPVTDTLATLVHEMCHQQQAEQGKEPTRCYHDRQWAGYMKAVGLQPSTTAAKGGKETGPRVSHYIIEHGRFANWCKEWLKRDGGMLLYEDRLAAERAGRISKGKGGEGEGEGEGEEAEPKSKGRIKFTCPGCELNAWAKPSAKLVCGACNKKLKATEAATVGGDEEES